MEDLGFEPIPWTDHVATVDWRVRLFCFVVCIGILVFGNTFLGAIFLFERGSLDSCHDPQKRTLINRLQSSAALLLNIILNIRLTLFLWKVIGGSVASRVYSILVLSLGLDHLGNAFLACLVEAMTIRYLSIHVWRSLPPFNEDFMNYFLIWANRMIPLFFASLAHFTGELESATALVYGSQHPLLADKPTTTIG